MDAKDLRTDAAIIERSKDGPVKYPPIGTTLPCGSNKNYQDISSNPLAKTDPPTTRPCAVIGPDRVLPPSTISDSYVKKNLYESWPSETTYRHPPEYPYKMTSYSSPIRNISPRQTFQENMQRIMVPPSYNSVNNEDINFTLDRNTSLTKNSKPNASTEPKYCDVPYSVNTISDNSKNADMCVSNVNNSRNYPPMWHPSGVNIRPVRPYGAPELYQYPEYTSCAASRPIPMARPQHSINENPGHLYPDTYYHQGNIRFRPYPNVKERCQQTRYDYINNYPNPFNPPPAFPTHKYDLQKTMPTHPSYPQVPIKYIENRMNESVIDGFQRQSQMNYNIPYQNQLIHPAYRPMLPNSLQNKLYPYPQENSVKTVSSNKVPYDNNKLYMEYENGRHKNYPVPENFYMNEMTRPHMKGQVLIPNYPTMNMQPVPPHPYYRKTHLAKNFEYLTHMRHVDPSMNTNITRLSSEFSPIAISPSESNASVDNLQNQGNLDDCGYVSQSSTASIRSIESSVNRMIPTDNYRIFNYPFPHVVRTPTTSKTKYITENDLNAKEKKDIDIRQFLQMWNEGDEGNAASTKEIVSQLGYNKDATKLNQHALKNQEQLYVLGSVNVSSEELGKYEHIQKVSKLPDNIKGCNNIELLKHFEEVIETSNLNNFSNRKVSSPRNFQPLKTISMPGTVIPARPVSPLDVEAKISQSVIHKEVGCNFEIKPCSPEMLNVEVATPAQNILAERVIEKVSNPYQSPVVNSISNNDLHCDEIDQNLSSKNIKKSSCKLINTQCSDSSNSMKANYSLQDLENNSGMCLASLPLLDNDIELNFTEVNQQFINANKESVIKSKDLQSASETKNLIFNNDSKNDSMIHSIVTPIKEPEKEFAKLSKYRKNKKSENEINGCHAVFTTQPMRTDSVIIKNPDNTKSFDESDYLSNNSKNSNIIQNESPNLDLPNILVTNIEPKNNNNMENIEQAPDEIAIDFSINKTQNLIALESEKVVFEENLNIIASCETNDLDPDLKDKNIAKSQGLPPSDLVSNHKTTNEERKTSELPINSPGTDESNTKDFSELETCTKEFTVNSSDIYNSGDKSTENAECSNGRSLCQDDTQVCLLLNESQNSNTITNNIQSIDVDVIDDSFIKFNASDDKTFPRVCDRPNVESHFNDPVLCDPPILKEDNIDDLSFHDLPEIEDNGIELKKENNCCDEVAQNVEVIKKQNDSPDDSAYVTLNLSNDELDKSLVCSNNKRFCLKKELFSPWIQKLICCNEDTDFPYRNTVKSPRGTEINDLCHTLTYENQPLSIDCIASSTYFHEDIENLPEKDHLDTTNNTTTATEKYEDTENINNNKESLSDDLDNKESLSEDSTLFVPNSLLNVDMDTVEGFQMKDRGMAVEAKADEFVCKNNTELLCQEEINSDVNVSEKRRCTLKRSLSDSELMNLSEDADHESPLWSKKRRKNIGYRNCDSSLISESLNNAQYNRRNSISSIYNEENLSFCILITQENEDEEKLSFAEIPENCYADIHDTQIQEGDSDHNADIILYPQEEKCDFSEPLVLEISDEKIFEQSWVDDVGCVETVVSDDIAEDVTVSDESDVTPSSPKSEDREHDETDILYNSASNHTEKVKYIYGDKMCNDDAELVETLYRTPQMNVNKTLTNRESHGSDDFDELESEIALKMKFESYEDISSKKIDNELSCSVRKAVNDDNKVESDVEFHLAPNTHDFPIHCRVENINDLNNINLEKTQDNTVNSCESSLDSVFSCSREGESSSPEVSSTTSEEKNSTILLKITNYKGMRTSQLNDTNIGNINMNNRNSCKFTENINYRNNNNPSKPCLLITKAAQKYIPPEKEPLDNFKVKLPLPQHSLLKLKQLKNSKTEIKAINNVKKEYLKKPKPKFEDVLKSIDEIQFKMHKERNKKIKKPVPKVVIKKNENGSHYASASDKDYFNPDLTGRKWQPWVFIEKSFFIDKMATKNKTKAIFNHRKNTYVFADKFKKYKSVASAKFVISQPKLDNSSLGQLKYTIRLKHSH